MGIAFEEIKHPKKRVEKLKAIGKEGQIGGQNICNQQGKGDILTSAKVNDWYRQLYAP